MQEKCSELRDMAKFMTHEERIEFFGLIEDGEVGVAEWYAEQAHKRYTNQQKTRMMSKWKHPTTFMRCGDLAIALLSNIGVRVRSLLNKLLPLMKKMSGAPGAKQK